MHGAPIFADGSKGQKRNWTLVVASRVVAGEAGQNLNAGYENQAVLPKQQLFSKNCCLTSINTIEDDTEWKAECPQTKQGRTLSWTQSVVASLHNSMKY